MFFIPGFIIAIIALITFPGVIVHEAAHRLFCDLAGVPVYKVCYFRIGNPSGYVAHGPTRSLRANFLITIGPLIVNTLLCAVISFVPAVSLLLNLADLPRVFVLLIWLGLSIGMHAFPSPQDAANFSAAVRASGRGFLYVVARLFQALVWLAHLLRFIWFDLIYAVFVALASALIVVQGIVLLSP